ncbi:FAD dependent oxidoreductase [Ruminiclostridium sufflavum DSM 19573]|uniref:FAD dependent oxidoreductase n=1 Tax=Ruminiclostridium sufflavum DSM 19573 TaxID=1121337 RepID=A0A318XIS7_9FIRM|nr:FAD-dependent oxidoreductase [Ruminiclostridium sufflavum]PYG87130.1 FAD dependent oxidoreductase [Ruminiclostridium sufflavum DSM 19573]
MYNKKYDLIVVGSGAGGFPAAIAAARRGLEVLLVERNAQIGGLLVSGLPILAFLDRSGNPVVKGIGQEIIDRLQALNGTKGHIPSPLLNSVTHVSAPWMSIILFEMCEQEENLDVLLYAELKEVKVDNGKMRGISVFCRGEEMVFEANLVIDATGDACVAYKAGAKYEKGDADGKGLQPPTITFELGNVDYEKLFDYLSEHPEGYKLPETFPGIEQTLDYFRSNICFTMMGFSDIVNEARKTGELTIPRNMIDICRQVNGNTFVNVTRSIDTDVTDFESIIKAEFVCHKQVKELVPFMQKYIPGFENAQLVSMIPFIGVRESRRIVGKKQLTLDNIKNLELPEDTVAIAGYNVDIHSPDSADMTMLTVKHGVGIPYGCLVPEYVEGLLMSGRTISVDQSAFAMTRVMSTCLAVGQAAGIAMAIAHKHGVLPSDIDVSELRAELKKDNALIALD